MPETKIEENTKTKLSLANLRGTKKERMRKRIREIIDKHATRFRKLPPEAGVRTSRWETVQEPEEKLYGGIEILEDSGKIFLAYNIRKGHKYVYSPDAYDEKGKLKPNQQPIDKTFIVEEKIEEVK